MNFRDLLEKHDIDPKTVLAMRHRPRESHLRRVLSWLALEDHDAFNTYQRVQGEHVARMLRKASYLAAFTGDEPGRGLFVGLYKVEGDRYLTAKEYDRMPGALRLRAFGSYPFDARPRTAKIPWFDLVHTGFYAHWKGRLVIQWPPPERAWARWLDRPNNALPIEAILEQSVLTAAMPEWHEIDLTWEQLRALPESWKLRLQEWRGIYYIFDTASGKGYVGSAYGSDNIYGRWMNYAQTSHGGNRRLRRRDPKNFRFTILERVSPDAAPADVIRLESSWKDRLHTRHPFGLNVT